MKFLRSSTTGVFATSIPTHKVPDPRKSFPTNNAKVVLVINNFSENNHEERQY